MPKLLSTALCACAFIHLLLFGAFQVGEIGGPGFQPSQSQPLDAPLFWILLHNTFDDLPLFPAIHTNPREGDFAHTEIDKAAAEFAYYVIVLPRHTDLKNLDFSLVQTDSLIELSRAGIL